MRIVFLCSGGGGNLRFIKACEGLGMLPGGTVAGVVTDRACGSEDFAREKGIPCFRVAYTKRENAPMKERLATLDPGVIVTNIHKVLDDELVDLYAGRMVNLHYSLLPEFGGTVGEEPIRRALAAGRSSIGTTVHLVDRTLDGGPILAQSLSGTIPGEPFEALLQRVFQAGCLNLLGVLRALVQGSSLGPLSPRGVGPAQGETVFTPPLAFDTAPFLPSFWQDLRRGA